LALIIVLVTLVVLYFKEPEKPRPLPQPYNGYVQRPYYPQPPPYNKPYGYVKRDENQQPKLNP
jgi:hypothetical protein